MLFILKSFVVNSFVSTLKEATTVMICKAFAYFELVLANLCK